MILMTGVGVTLIISIGFETAVIFWRYILDLKILKSVISHKFTTLIMAEWAL
jgi:hypothetical protein